MSLGAMVEGAQPTRGLYTDPRVPGGKKLEDYTAEAGRGRPVQRIC